LLGVISIRAPSRGEYSVVRRKREEDF
jgi:hypothetical protein